MYSQDNNLENVCTKCWVYMEISKKQLSGEMKIFKLYELYETKA